jgi:hypothetical protein
MLNVLDNGCRFCDVWEGSGSGDCNGIRVEDFELREGMKKRFVGRHGVLLLVFISARLVFLDNRRCSLGERGITTVEDDNPNLEKRGVTS